MKNRLLEDLKKIRKNDDYGNAELENELQEVLFPKDPNELALNLSNVTGSFYGYMLKNIGDKIGFDKIDQISKNTFYDIGKAKSDQCKSKMESLPKDTRTFFIVLASAVFSSSPEYSFKVIEYSKEKTRFEINGIDRYLRALRELGIKDYVTFPTLIPFMNGIKDFFGINCEMKFDLKINNKNNETKCVYEFTLI